MLTNHQVLFYLGNINIKMWVVSCIATCTFNLKAYGYNFKSQPNLKLLVGSVIYQKAELLNKVGVYSPSTRPITSFVFGVQYNIMTINNWGILSGISITKEPLYNFNSTINSIDLYTGYDNILLKSKEYLSWSISLPLLIHYNLQATNNSVCHFSVGLNIKHFSSASGEYTYTINNLDESESREIFGLRIATTNERFYGSFIVGTGIRFVQKKYTYGFNLFYVHNFQNLYEGEYLYGNLMLSGESRGKYYHSGNHFGLTFCIGKNKRKDKVK